MYYNKYDFLLFAEGYSEQSNLINQDIKYRLSKKNEDSYIIEKDADVVEINSFNDIVSTKYPIYKILSKEFDTSYEGSAKYSQKIENGEIVKKIIDIVIRNPVSIKYTSGFKTILFINNKKVESSAVFGNNEITISITSSNEYTYDIIKASCNRYKLYICEDTQSVPKVDGFSSDEYNIRPQFSNMESLEGDFSYNSSHRYAVNTSNISSIEDKKILEKKYTISIIEPEYQKTILNLFKNYDIIKIIKMYPDRIEEFYNCSLSSESLISEEKDVNKRNISILCTQIYIRYFYDLEENTLRPGGILLD